MLRALWFFIRVGLIVAVAVWVASQPGDVALTWFDYTFKVQMGFFLLCLLAIILFSIFLYNVIDTFMSFPASYRRYREIKSREDGYRALTLGLTAVAAGDKKVAAKQAKKTAKLMPDDMGLPKLLQAQAARMEGKSEEARKHFAAMMDNKDAAFLGVRGLLQEALDHEDYRGALKLAHGALESHPKQPWVLKTVYDLQIKAKGWNGAQQTLKRLEKTDSMTRGKVISDRAVLSIAEGEEKLEGGYIPQALELFKRAHRILPEFAPAAVRLARLYKQEGKRRAAMGVIKKSWKLQPHPELEEMWMELMTPSKAAVGAERAKWKDKLTGGAVVVYGDKEWVCTQSGRVYPEWHWITDGGFNTLVWDEPRAGVLSRFEESSVPHEVLSGPD